MVLPRWIERTPRISAGDGNQAKGGARAPGDAKPAHGDGGARGNGPQRRIATQKSVSRGKNVATAPSGVAPDAGANPVTRRTVAATRPRKTETSAVAALNAEPRPRSNGVDPGTDA